MIKILLILNKVNNKNKNQNQYQTWTGKMKVKVRFLMIKWNLKLSKHSNVSLNNELFLIYSFIDWLKVHLNILIDDLFYASIYS